MAGAGGNDVTGGSALVSGTFSFGGNSNMSWEVGLEFAGRRGTNDYTSWPIGARLEAIFGRGSAYLLAGGAGLLEFVTDDLTDEQYTNGVMTVDLGGGLRIGGSADLRLRYEVLLGSDNLDGQAAVSMGYAF
jgi:hypothetical protein